MIPINHWIHTIKNYPNNIKKFLIANLFIQFGLGIFMILYNLYIKSIGLPHNVNGQIISMQALATAIALIPAGVLGDRYGRKKFLLFGISSSGIMFLVRSLLETNSLLIVFAFMSGIFFSFVQVSIVPFLADNSTSINRVELFSINFSLQMIANMFGNISGGVISDALQQIFHLTEVSSIRISLIIGSVIFIFAAIPLLQIKEQRRQYQVKSFVRWDFSEKKDQYFLILKFTLGSLIIGSGSGLVIPYLNLYFRERFYASDSSIGIVVALGQLATAIAMIIGPWIVKKVGEVKAVVILQLSSIPFLLLTGYTKIYVLAAVGFLIRQALMNAGNPIQQSLMMDKIDDSKKGLANSLGQMVFQLGWAFMGPISTSIVASNGSYYGYAKVFTITAVIYIIGSMYFLAVFKSFIVQTKKG